MGFKKYIVFSFLLIILIFGYVFSLEPGEYTITILDKSLTLSIAFWIILPLIIFFILSLAHMIFYNTKSYLKYRSILKDEENIFESIKAYLLQKNDKTIYKTKAFKDITNVLSQINFEVKDNVFNSSNDEINKIVLLIKDIKNGKYVQNKYLKLDPTSPLAHKNVLNKVNTDVDFCVEVLKKPNTYSFDIVKEAFLHVLEKKSITTIKKLYKDITLDKQMGEKLLEKNAKNLEFGINNEEIITITKNLNYDKNDFINLAKTLKKFYQPDDLILLFEELYNEVELSVKAYFYILFEFEMIDKIRELLSNHPKDEQLSAFRALMDLKDANKQYSLENICYKN